MDLPYWMLMMLLMLVMLMTVDLSRIKEPDLAVGDRQGRHGRYTRRRDGNMASVEFFPEGDSELSHDVRAGTVDALFDFEAVSPRLAVLVQVAFGLEGKAARLARIRSLVGVSPDVFVQNTRLGADHLTKGTDVPFPGGRVEILLCRCRS